MKTWDDYKNHVKSIDAESKADMEEIEDQAAIIGALIARRNEMGITQRDLAAMCGMPQSSIARIESYKTTPSIETMLKLMRPLGLKLNVTSV